jgi:hypothetical protein
MVYIPFHNPTGNQITLTHHLLSFFQSNNNHSNHIRISGKLQLAPNYTTTTMAIRIASLLLAISPALIAGQDFVVGSSDSGACIGSYCCDGSLIGDTGNSNDASDFICCLGDPNHGIINGVPDMTCSAGSAVPLTAATGSVATTSATMTSAASSSVSATSESSFDDDSDSSDDDFPTSNDDETPATAAAASDSMVSSTTSQRSSASSSGTPTSSSSNTASTSSGSTPAGATGNAAVGQYQFSAGQIAVGLLALGYNIAL